MRHFYFNLPSAQDHLDKIPPFDKSWQTQMNAMFTLFDDIVAKSLIPMPAVEKY